MSLRSLFGFTKDTNTHGTNAGTDDNITNPTNPDTFATEANTMSLAPKSDTVRTDPSTNGELQTPEATANTYNAAKGQALDIIRAEWFRRTKIALDGPHRNKGVSVFYVRDALKWLDDALHQVGHKHFESDRVPDTRASRRRGWKKSDVDWGKAIVAVLELVDALVKTGHVACCGKQASVCCCNA